MRARVCKEEEEEGRSVLPGLGGTPVLLSLSLGLGEHTGNRGSCFSASRELKAPATWLQARGCRCVPHSFASLFTKSLPRPVYTRGLGPAACGADKGLNEARAEARQRNSLWLVRRAQSSGTATVSCGGRGLVGLPRVTHEVRGAPALGRTGEGWVQCLVNG